MQPATIGLIMLILILLCVVIVVIIRCREMKADWQEKQPPRLRDYFWNIVESILEFFD